MIGANWLLQLSLVKARPNLVRAGQTIKIGPLKPKFGAPAKARRSDLDRVASAYLYGVLIDFAKACLVRAKFWLV